MVLAARSARTTQEPAAVAETEPVTASTSQVPDTRTYVVAPLPAPPVVKRLSGVPYCIDGLFESDSAGCCARSMTRVTDAVPSKFCSSTAAVTV